MYTNNHSYYSLRYGTIGEQELLELAVECGAQTLVLTDINNTSGCLNFVRLAQQRGHRAALGVDFRNGNTQLYVGIAKNNSGFQELNAYLSAYLQDKKPFPEQAPAFEHVYVIYPLERVMELDKIRFRESELIGISIAALRKLPFTKYVKMTDKLVVLQTVSFRNKRDFNIHRLLRSIDLNILLSQLPTDQQGDPNDVMMPVKEL
ncbi:MAG: PHP domain-containing protein, partial [Nonlabens sp.]|nr:PHP domain-containing protein [Nonlabens sp.]